MEPTNFPVWLAAERARPPARYDDPLFRPYVKAMSQRAPERFVYTAEQMAERDAISKAVIRELICARDLTDDRIAELPALESSAGPSYAFWRLATDAVRGEKGRADRVDWAQVEEATIKLSMGEHGQDAKAVLAALCAHSPGAVTSERQAELATLVDEAQKQFSQATGVSRNTQLDAARMP